MRFQPYFIKIEIVNLVPKEAAAVQQILSDNHYTVTEAEMDLIAIRAR